jgi:hypothetical protein
MPPAPEPVAAAPEKPKPPYEIWAKTIDTWVSRMPAPPKPPTPAKPGDKPATKPESGKGQEEPGVKYQLDRARCEDNVKVHQEPTDPTKARGVDIFGRLLLIDGSPDGNIMTVFGWPTRAGEVHQEEMSLIGPEIKLDQVHNTAYVKGRGALTMPTNSDLAGGELAQPEVVVIHWRDSMDFKGALRSAEFVGKVSAQQGESWVLCSTMHVKFDRPVYFNQAQRSAAPPPKAATAKGPNPKDPKNPNAKGAPDDDKPKIDTVFCYPAAGDAADDPRELLVVYNQVEFDKTGKMIKSQQLTAQELRMFAQAQDPGGGEKYQRVEADGPGVLRIWQMGDKDAGPGANNGNKSAQPGQPARPTGQPMGPQPGAPKQPGAPGQPGAPAKPGEKPGEKPADDDQEMKLTVIDFTGSMVAIDKAKLYQQANFKGRVQVINIPSDSPLLEVQRHKLPPRAQLLNCNKELIVWSHKKPNAPTAQRMDAYGNAYIRTDEYDGWGEVITHDGQVVIMTGSEAVPARIMNRFNRGNEQAGKKIIYDRANGRVQVIESLGGTLGAPGK